MTEFEEINGKLQLVKEPCKHEWSDWTSDNSFRGGWVEYRNCLKCEEKRLLVPKGTTAEELKPGKLPVRSSFSLFLADWKAARNR